MEKGTHSLRYILKSRFIRSIFLQVVTILFVVVAAIVILVFSSFSSEINKSIIADKEAQLDAIEETISTRMDEAALIAYSIAQDERFHLEPVNEPRYSGHEMSEMLKRYLIGNEFIRYIAYYRLAEPNSIYTSIGVLPLHQFWGAYLNMTPQTEAEYMAAVVQSVNAKLLPAVRTAKGAAYFTYVYALPQFSTNPQAFVMMLIPLSRVEPVIASQLSNCYGKLSVFSAAGEEIISASTLDTDIPLTRDAFDGVEKTTVNGDVYIVQRKVARTNGWTYVSLVRLNDIVSGLVKKQSVFIVLLIVLMLAAVVLMLSGIIRKYKPISALALDVSDAGGRATDGGLIDEKDLLASRLAALRDDSEQKQRFESKYHEAEAANRAKSSFLSNMSHDIRTPMNAIVGMTELALKNSDDSAYVRECLYKVQLSSRYLLDIINNVLDMSRIESGRITLSDEAVELPRLIYSVESIINQSAVGKKQRLSIIADGVEHEKVMGDAVRLAQVFINILSNAVKYTPEGGEITLRVSQSPSKKEGFVENTFVFSDTGMGMTEEFVGKVFNSFARSDRAALSGIEGTGLGMAIAKNLVELMGGTIRCETELDKGTTFTIELPMRIVPDELDESIRAMAKALGNAPVLILTDDEALGCRQRKLFEAFGLCARVAATASEAVAQAMAAKADGKAFRIVLIDQSGDDPNGVRDATALISAVGREGVRYVLASMDDAGIEPSAPMDAWVEAFVRIPLFKSSLLAILGDASQRPDALRRADSTMELQGKRILIAEDNELNRMVARKILAQTHAELVEAVNGKAAVEAFAGHEPGYFDVILMDIRMPVMDGYEATALIRAMKRPDAKTIPIFALTANTFDDDVRQVKEAGMNGHLGKPYVQAELYAVLRRAIRMSAPDNDA